MSTETLSQVSRWSVHVVWTNSLNNMPLSQEEQRKIAELFHDTYETLAPAYGYETREDTKQFDPESKNGKLMMAVCGVVLNKVLEEKVKEVEGIKRIRGEKPYMWLITNDTPTEIGKYDEHWKIVGHRQAISDVINLLSSKKDI